MIKYKTTLFDTDKLFRKSLSLSALIVVVLLLSVFFTLFFAAFPSIKTFGLKFLVNKSWDPAFENFGALPFFAGTLITSFLALIISLPFSLSISVLLGEYLKEGFIASSLTTIIELLSGIPSILYGFFGLLVLAPIIRSLELKLGVAPYGVGIFTASLILSIMIIPYSAMIGREVIALVPRDIKEAALSLGATKQETILKVIIPYSRSGIFAGILLSLGRALGETMAVTMVIGNSNYLPKSLFDPSNTIASLIANEFAEATGDLYLSALFEAGLILLITTTIVNLTGKYIIKRYGV